MDVWQRIAAFSTGVGPDDAHEEVDGGVRLLRVLGWLIAGSAALAVLNAVIITPITLANTDLGPFDIGPVLYLTTIMGLIWTAVFTGGALFWIGWTLEQWATGARGGHTSALVLAIIATVFYGIGSLAGIAGSIAAAFAFSAGNGQPLAFGGSWLGIPLTVASLVVSIMLLVAIQKPEVKQHFGLLAS